MNRATRKMPPVQGLSQPYTWPIPTGMALRSCGMTGSDVCYGSRQLAQTSTPKSHTNTFWTGSYYVSQAGFGFLILLPQPLECTLTFYNRIHGRHYCSSRLRLKVANALSSQTSMCDISSLAKINKNFQKGVYYLLEIECIPD